MSRCLFIAVFLLLATVRVRADERGDLGDEGFVDSDGVKLHYVSAGKGPLVVLLHGFPDYSYTWRDQMPALAKHFHIVALDLRGYNKSDQPKGVENYAMEKLVGDVAAVLNHFKQDKATIIGHDWGGAIAWAFAMRHPEQTERLVIPHRRPPPIPAAARPVPAAPTAPPWAPAPAAATWARGERAPPHRRAAPTWG